MSSKSLGEEIYSGAATVGVVTSTIKAIFGSIIGLIMLIVGIILVSKRTVRTEKVSATIEKIIKCNEIKEDKKPSTYSCTFTASYTINNKEYINTFTTTGNIEKFPGEIITLYYDPNNTSDILPESDNFHILGWILIGISIFMVASLVTWAYVAYKYKPIAALTGTVSSIEMVKSVF